MSKALAAPAAFQDPDAGDVAQVRRLNRVLTERIGALREGYLHRGRSLAASRLLWEIRERGADLRGLRARLGLDSGYLSRLLRSLEAEGLVTVGPSEADRRVRVATLTPRGQRERAVLDRRSDDLAASILEPLSTSQRARLIEAMGEVERLLRASAVDLRVVAMSSPDAQRCLRRYFEELVARTAAPAGSEDDLSREAAAGDEDGTFVVAYLGGEAVGCCGLRTLSPEVAEVKRMWVDPQTRGLGLGRRLLDHMEGLARESGARAVRLDTNEHLTEAITMYRSAGYRDIPRYTESTFATHWFEKTL